MSQKLVDLTRSSSPTASDPRAARTDTLLKSAIETAQPARLRDTLQSLCGSLPDAAKVTAALLLITEEEYKKKIKRTAEGNSSSNIDSGADDADYDDSDDGEENGTDDKDEEESKPNSVASANTSKHVRPRYAVCEN